MNIIKRSLAMLLTLCMLFSAVPTTALADEADSTTPAVTEPVAETTEATTASTEETTVSTEETTVSTEEPAEATEDSYAIATTAVEIEEASLSYADAYRILHLDCGRKYFTADWIKALINEMAAAGYTHLELAFGNDGLRFLLNDMSVGSYTDEQVTAAIQQGNRNYHNFDTNELTESEMNTIITHADSKGIKIIPLLNNPGHMNAIVSAASTLTGSSAGYNGSSSTVDLENADAVAFVKGLVEKYVAYFDGKGCNEFNFGADEYANDVYPGGSMGFGALTTAGKYQLFVNYVNEMAAMIKGYGMVPIAFNDGIYFNHDTSYNFDKQIMVAFWTSGWSGYQSASASTMAALGHKMINVNGDYYYILGKSDQWDSNGYTYASNWSNSAFMGSTVSNPAGSMYCIWCDYPNAETETQIAANNRLILRAMAAAMQGEDIYSISTEVVSGGFNADGTINSTATEEPTPETPETVTKTESGVSVTAYDLTDLTVTEATAPTVEGATAVLAWDMIPETEKGNYTGSATVSVPVHSDWTNVRGGVVATENGAAVSGITGTLKDGVFTFTVPHFSTVYAYNLDATAVDPDETIELEVGGTHEIVIKNVDYNGAYATNPEGIATVVAVHEEVAGSGGGSVSSLTAGSAYYIKNEDGLYLAENGSWVDSAEKAVAWTAELLADGLPYYYLSYNYKYLAEPNNSGVWSTGSKNDGALFSIENGKLMNSITFDEYTATEGGSAAVNQSTITFSGIAPGTTYATVGDTTYKIVVHGTIDITIKYQTADGTIIKTETVSVRDDATSVTVSNFNHNGKFYTVDNTTLNITPATVTEYTVTVTEVEEDLSQVASLTVEYWQTNATVVETRGGTDSSKSIAAADAYSENGIALTTVIPMAGYKKDGGANDPDLGYWRSRLLERATNEQTGENGDDETLNGTGFTKVRYWNGTWAVYTDAGEWQNITLDEYQLVAYYMNDMHLADEVSVSTSDWGKKGNGEFGGTYLGASNVSLAFQIVYDGGTTSPVGTGVELAPYTYFVDHWGNRGVGTVAINQIGNYKIWKITAETGEHSVTHTGQYEAITVNGFTWDNNEMVVWEDENNPVSHYTILNPAKGPYTDGYYDNLRWNEQNESILIRIYLATEETEDSLKVVYYDEKFNATLAEFPINVPNGSNFNNGIVVANTTNSATLPEFEGNADRKNATGYGIVNALEKTQNFETNLANVAITNNRYNADLYMYTGSVISEDGKTITHYYNINQKALSPNFVADFGLPLTFNLSDVVKEGIDTVKNVTVTPTTKFGTLEYNSDTQTFTYTPTKILTTIDVLTISILFDGEETATTTNVGVTPATTVHYEESFITWGSGWTGGTTKPAMTQNTAVLGEDTNNYGYDSAYETVTGASNGTNATTSTIGATGSFTFTGNGIQVFANATESSGYVSVQVKNSSGAIVNMAMVDTIVDEGTTSVTSDQTGSLYGLPIVSLIDLQNMPHDTYTVTLTKIMDTEPVYIDGIRVFNTVEDSTIFANDLEDKPEFYELRDYVLNALSIGTAAKLSADELDAVVDQVYAAISSDTEAPASAVITSGSNSVITGTSVAQDLLENGPKNELYLYNGQTLTFKVTSSRIMQIGLKAPQGATTASVSINGGTATEQTVMSSVDMFYNLVSASTENATEYTVSITNNGSNILSVTLLKVCDDPSFAFASLTSEDIENVLTGVYGLTDDEETETPTEPEIPEETPEPETKPSKPYKPYKPSKPGKPGSSKPGNSNRPGRPAEDTEPAEEEAVLNIVFINLWGRKVGTATLTESGNENDRCVFSASEISAQAPGNYWALWLFPAIISYGDTATIIVTVL